MAEAVRYKPTKIKKPAKQKCLNKEEEEKGVTKENTPMEELLEEYGNVPLPEIESTVKPWREREQSTPGDDSAEALSLTLTDSLVLMEGERTKNVEDPEIYLGKQSLEILKEEGMKRAEDSEYPLDQRSVAIEKLEATDQSALRDTSVLAETSDQAPSAPGYTDLQNQLLDIEPHYVAQQQLNKLKVDHDTEENEPTVSDNVDNEGDGGDVCASAPYLEDSATVQCSDIKEQKSGVCVTGESVRKVNDIRTKVKLTEESSILEPMNEVQINALYQNTELQENDSFIGQFIEQERNIPQLEFYELVLGYLRARTNLIGSQKELSTIQEDYHKQRGNVWIFEKRVTTEEGECEDGRLLTVQHEYEVACFKEKIATHMSKLLKQSRELIANSYALHAYESEMSKLQVENYMQKILSEWPDYAKNAKQTKIHMSGRKEHLPALQPHITKLKTCISVLFEFQRRGVKDQQFVRDTRQWLTDLIAVLHRCGTRLDHLFILNHVLRCPAGVGTWAASYIQVGGPWRQDGGGGMLGCWPLDHALTILTTLMHPVAERQEFLHHIRHTALPNSKGEAGRGEGDGGLAADNVWVVVDSSGEEEEDPAQLWACFTENDVIQILNQVPFKEIFQHMLLFDDEACPKYAVLCTTHQGFLKLFAFATNLIKIFEAGLKTYAKVRYRGVTKRICRLLRHTVEYITEHWQNYLSAHQGVTAHHTDILKAAPQWASLQIEYDQLFEKAVESIFSSPRSGAWQFLAVIPYCSVSLSRLWKIVYKLHTGMREEAKQSSSKDSEPKVEGDWVQLISHADTRGQFHDSLLRMEENESFYLLSALANMAAAREPSESDFLKVVVDSIFEATFVNEGTREVLSRNGRDLLAMVAASHPHCVSYLLSATQEKISCVGSMALYLFRALPLELWYPSEEDITSISHWLLFMPASSVENELARVVLSNLNWGENDTHTQLVLPQELHQRVALTVLEAHTKICQELSSGGLLTEGVKHVTSVVYSPSPEKVFFEWSWKVLTRLRLHRLDQPLPVVCAMLSCPASLLANLTDPTSVTITRASSLNVVKRGMMDKNPLALFAALLLTTWGHSIPEFCEHGVECIHELVSQGRHEAALYALGHIMPLFFPQPEDIITNTKLMRAIQKCVAAEQTYITMAKSLVTSSFPGKILTLFAAVIVQHINNYSRYNLSSGAPAVRFWLQLLIGVPEWVHDSSVLFLLDTICHHSFTSPNCWQEVLREFVGVMKIGDGTSVGGGVMGLLSWLTAGTAAPNSLLVRASSPQFPWFTLAVLTLETQQELASGLWKTLLLELFNNPQSTLEQAFKKVQGELGQGPGSVNLLSIYRWGQQVVDLPADHPALLVTLQMYFLLHLSRVPPQPGQYECCSVVSRFYQGYINSAFLGKIKKKVSSTLEHYQAQLTQDQEEDGPVDPRVVEQVKLVRGMQAWLEEERLYEAGVYLPALPPHLLPQKLMLIFQGNWEPWPEAVNPRTIEENAEKLLRVWDQPRTGCSSGSPSLSPQHKAIPQRQREKSDPRQSIMKRVLTYDPPQPPPPVPPRSPLHTPQLQHKTLADHEALLYHVHHYTELIVEHSQAISLWCSEMCALDCVYLEVLPQLWANATTKTILTAKCKPPKVGRQQPECAGHASIVMEFLEARRNEREQARVDQNREQHEAVLQRCQKPPPLQLCQATVSLEAIITTMVNGYRRAQEEGSQHKSQALLTSGRHLFYHIVQLTSEETSFYPPAKQLISSCAEVLGQEFVGGHQDCQEGLVRQVLDWGGQMGGLLAPHFTPSVCPTRTFLSLYASLTPHAATAPDHTFMLLSKFDIETWLSKAPPSSSDQSELINSVGGALSCLLPRPNSRLLLVLELYRVHLRILLNYKFPEHYAEVLTVLLHISSTTQEECGGVSAGLWFDMINTFTVSLAHFSPTMERMEVLQAIREFSQHQTRLSQSMVEDTLKRLSNFFVKQRLEFGLYGLYPKYQLHIKPISIFLCLISHTYIVTTFNANWGALQDDLLKEMWVGVEGLWTGWVAPLGGQERQSCPAWLRHLTHGLHLLLPWAPSDAPAADNMVAMFVASLQYMHELLPGRWSVLSQVLEYYSATYATKDVKSHVLGVVQTHLAALPWHHLHPSLQDTLIFSKVVEEYLPECHSFVGGVLVQINWSKVLQQPSPASAPDPTHSHGPVQQVGEGGESQLATIKQHTCLLNLLTRISMEPSVRQSPLLQTLLLEAEGFCWWLVDGDSFQRVVNWWVMSCDPRIVLSLPDRSPVDVAIIQLLHQAAGYTPDTRCFHQDTGAKRGLLVRALVRLLTSAAARHKALLSARPQVFSATIQGLLTHMEDTLIATVPKEQQWGEGCSLSTEVLAVVSGGASPAALQELGSCAVVGWLHTQPHPSPGLLLPLLASASRSILHLNHRNPILQEALLALFVHAEWSGWEGEVTWPSILSLLSYPLTNPSSMLTLAAQEGHLLVMYAHTCWRRRQIHNCTENLLLLTSLCDLLEMLPLNADTEVGVVLLISEVLSLLTQLVYDSTTRDSVWQHCEGLSSQLAAWAEDHATTGLLAAIGLARQSPLSLRFRLLCRSLATFLSLQMPREGVFRTHPLQTHNDVDGVQKRAGQEKCTMEQFRALTTNSTYSSLSHSILQALQFLEDPAHCLADVGTLLARQVAELFPEPCLRHLSQPATQCASAPPSSSLTTAAAAAPSAPVLSPSAPLPPSPSPPSTIMPPPPSSSPSPSSKAC